MAGAGACDEDRAIPTNNNGTHPCYLSLEPGRTYTGVGIDTVGLTMGKFEKPRVAAGLDITLSNVVHTYDPATRKGRVTFNAVVGAQAESGPREVRITYGNQTISSSACLGTAPAPGTTAQCLAAPTPALCCQAGQNLYQGSDFPDLMNRSEPPNPDCIFSKGGIDQVWASHGADFVSAGAANDTVFAGGAADVVLGEAGDDQIYSGEGNDTLFGGLGNDILWGELGHDWLLGGTEHDAIYGGDGDDQIFGGAGNDALEGGAGNDFIRPGPGLDAVQAGDGNDRVEVLHPCEVVAGEVLIGGRDDDTLALYGSLAQLLAKGAVVDEFEHIIEFASGLQKSECAP